MHWTSRSLILWMATITICLILHRTNAEADYDDLNVVPSETEQDAKSQDPVDKGRILPPVSQFNAPLQQSENAIESEEDILFRQFRMTDFAVTTLNESTVFFEWSISNATNNLDSNRLLNISTIRRHRTDFVDIAKITMSRDICRPLESSYLKRRCRYTFTVHPCLNYLLRLGGERNTQAVTTVRIDPPSLRAELSENVNGPLKLSWNITCENDFITPVYVNLTDLKTLSLKREKLDASFCENRQCVTYTEKLRTSPCSNYSLQIDGSDPQIVFTPPNTMSLSGERIPFQYLYILRWSIFPVNCPYDPLLLVAQNNDSSRELLFNRLTFNAQPKDICIKGSCEYMFEVDPCVTYRIKTNNLNSSLKLLIPSVSALSIEYTGDLKKPIKVYWKFGCHIDLDDFSIILTDETSQQKSVSNLTGSQCTESLNCSAYLKWDHNRLLPCNRYELEMEGSRAILKFETPPPSSITTRLIATTYSLNGSLTLFVSFDGIQESCAKWKNSMELQFLDMPTDVIHKLSCLETGKTSTSLQKNCTLFIQMDETVLCRSALHLKIRPLFSTMEENVTLYRGSWTDTTIKQAEPQGWDKDEAFKNFVVEANFRNQSLMMEWKNPICLKGSASFTANFSIVSGPKHEYHFTIPARCSRSKNDLSKNSVTINNGEVTCSDGKKLDMKTNFKLQPCREYSLTATPLVSNERYDTLSAYSNTNTFTTEFLPLEIDSLSPDEIYVTASHFSGYLWKLTLYVKKEYSPCDERLVSSTFIVPNSKQIDQTISCNRSLVCNGVVEFNHINLCRPLTVTVGLQYFNSNNSKSEITIWFNNSLPPLVDEHNKSSSLKVKVSKVKTLGRHFLELQWKDPTCLNGIVVSWDMEFRHENGSLLDVLNIPYNCSSVNTSDGKLANHRIILEENQLVCGGENSSIKYYVDVVSCSDYSINVTPVIVVGLLGEGMHTRVREFSQLASFTTLFNTSALRDIKIVNISSNNFELQWTIPSRCLPVFEINLQMNGTLFLIEAPSFSKSVCDENDCRMVWSPSEISLAPCTDYTVIVESTSITLTTFPGNNELAVAPENISVTVELSNDNYLGIKIIFDNFGNCCLDRLVGVELNFSDVEPPIQQILLQCDRSNSSENQDPSSHKVCKERIKIQKIDKCKTHNLALRPLYGNISLFSNDLVRWTHTVLSPLLSEPERSEKKMIPLVKLIETDNQQKMMVYWDDPICLLADSLSWEVRLNSSSHSRSVRLSSKCSSGWHLPANIKATSLKHNLQLINGHLSGCNASTSAFDSLETDFIFLPCSSYLVSVIPFDWRKVIHLEDYSQSTHLSTSLSEVHPKVKNVTSNSFGLEWTFPIQCSQQVEMRQIFVEINGTPVEIDPSNRILECDDTKCTMLWASPQNLSACTEYTVSAGTLNEKVLTLSDQWDPLEHFTTCDFKEGTIAEATDVSYRSDNATFITGDLFLIALIIGLSLLGSTLLGIITWIGFSILKRKSTRNNSGKLRIQKHDKHNFPPPAIYGEKDEFGMVDIVF